MWANRQSLVSLFGVVLLTTAITGLAIDQDKVGYIDKTGKVVIEPQFATADSFSEGLAMVRFPTK